MILSGEMKRLFLLKSFVAEYDGIAFFIILMLRNHLVLDIYYE